LGETRNKPYTNTLAAIKEMTREEKVEEFYCYYGKFCVRFEHVMTNVRGNIDAVFKQIGIKDYKYVLALLNKDTSHQLSDKLKLVAKIFYYWPVSYEERNGQQVDIPRHQKSIDIITTLSNYIKDVAEYRNLIVHGTWNPDLQTSGSFDLIIGNYHRPKIGEGTVVRTNAIEVSILKSICSDLIEITVLQKEIADLISSKKPLDSIENNEIFKKIPEMKKKLTIKDLF
jgi:hypothetical protein